MLPKEQTKYHHDDLQFEIMESSLASSLEDRHITKVAWAIALYLVLAALWVPGFSWGEKVYKVDRETRVEKVVRKVLRPPVEVPMQKVKTNKRNARKVPMPDMTPTEPEPYIEPDEPEVPEVLPSEEWEIGIPDAPPAPTKKEVIHRVGQIGVEPPIFTHKEMPTYPHLAQRLRIRGYVILEAILRKDGSIDSIKVLRDVGEGKFGFEEEAIKSLKKWQFMPGKVNGKPADVSMTLKVDFLLVSGEGT